MTGIYRKIGIASGIMMASVFLSRIIGIVRTVVIAGIGGAGGEVDAYQAAFALPEILNHLVVSGFLSITFIPIFSKYLAQDREEEGWRVFSIILTLSGTLLIALIIGGEFATGPLMGILTPGKTNPADKALILRMTRIILPAQFFFFSGGLFMAVQFAKERFFIPALAPLIYNVSIIIGGLLLNPRIGIEGFSWGVFGGALLGNFMLQIIGAKRAGMRYFASFDIRHPDLRKYILLTVPLMIGLTPNYSIELLSRFFGSFLPEGGISCIIYAFRIVMVVVGLFGQAVASAFFPFISRLVAENNMAEANRLLNRTLRFLTLALPVTTLLMVLRTEVVTILFKRGAFDDAATALTANVLLFLMPTAVAMAAYALVVRGYYAAQNTLFPALFSTTVVLLSLPLYYFGMQSAGHNGIAMAMSLSTGAQALLLYMAWNRRSHNTGSRKVYLSFIRMGLLSAAMGLGLEAAKHLLTGALPTEGFLGCLLTVAVTGIAGLVFLAAAGFVLRMEEIIDPLHKIRHVFSRQLNRN